MGLSIYLLKYASSLDQYSVQIYLYKDTRDCLNESHERSIE